MNEQQKIDSILSAVFGLSPKLCHLLRLLLSVPVASTDLICEELDIEYDPRVVMYRLRKRLYPHGVVVQSQYGGNYWLTKDMKAMVREIVRDNT
jgi:predicted transcriptional regulator